MDFYIENLKVTAEPELAALSLRERRMLRMLVAATCAKVLEKEDSLEQGVSLLWSHPQIVLEMNELFTLLREQIDHIHTELLSHQDVPLQVHGKYSRIEILAALGVGDYATTRPWREGVLWIEAEQVDVLAFALGTSD